MDDREEITKRLLKIFLPFVGVLTCLVALAYYIEDKLEIRPKPTTFVEAAPQPLDPESNQVKRHTAPSPTLAPAPKTNTSVTLREDAVDLFDQLDDKTLDLLDEVEGELDGNALQRMQAGIKLITQLNDQSVKAITAERLKTVLPDDMPGWTAGKITAKSTSLLGIHTSMARRSYTDAKGRKAFVKIMDTASMKQVSALGAVATGAAEIITETDEYIEKTILIGSMPAFAKYAKKTKSVKIHAFTHSRFIIEANSNDLSIAELATRVSALNLDLLDEFVTPEPEPVAPSKAASERESLDE